MFEPEDIDQIALNENSIEIAKMIMMLQNENPFPETGTLGFIMGLAIALGNTASIYATGMSRYERREFKNIFTNLASDCYKDPFVKGTIIDNPIAH